MNATSLPPAQDLGHGIVCIDTLQERPGLACCYLVGRDGEYAFVEAGTAHGMPRLLALLEARGIAREQVRYVIPTHVHLDHAGGAGVLMRELPAAQLVAHPRGARHLIDPSKLIAGAEGVYGKAAVAEMYGEIAAVPEERVIVAGDDHRLPLGAGELRFIDSPGHARHHFSIWDETSHGFFTGDTFGLSYREFDGPGGPYLFPTTTPVQFEPEAWFGTLDRYLSFDPQRMYLTHFSVVENVQKLAADLRAGLQRYVALATPLRGSEQRHQALLQALNQDALAALKQLGSTMPEARVRELLAFDIELNAQGLEVWLDRPA
ncbi:MBL fold metallo-hydrolase [Solimonas sp. K1W22B-7]|uniref:MBL fold metallo-hydrolase n=1 Tax=Solimonas sp. K1W22B-7 TaxID=2303331 RepID=UPI000E32EC0C|nr:MBL fold metallo-hydrolase [Solimonas sp. K1W22B-7]AXQ29547.1 MBL fold metallo-hydrolase [Solimonas sp. K1W22B-7]